MAIATRSGGNNPLQQLQPTQTKALYQGNYLDFTNADFGQWTQQFLPDVYDQEINIYGNRTISGFLKMVSAEMPSTSDQIIWTEQGRLHARYTNVFPTATATGTARAAVTADSTSLHFVVPAAQEGASISDISFRVGQTVMMQQSAAAGLQGDSDGVILKGIITAVNTRNFSVSFYNAGDVAAIGLTDADVFTALVYGSEYAKGSDGMTGTIHPQYKTYSNSPIIMKDHFGINGSDTSQIGWIEIDSENGASGYLWYMKSEHENRLRWEDYMEMSMLESITADSTSSGSAAGTQSTNSIQSGGTNAGTLRGTEGLFQALDTRGNVWEGLSSEITAAASGSGSTAAGYRVFDEILKIMDKNAAVEENMLYVDRNLSLAFDDMLAYANQGGTGADSAVSFGVFNNSKDMSLNLGFSGFRRGSYDFYKTDWKYLNDWSTRGGFGDIEGLLIPAGTSTVYDEVAGGNVKRPFCHIRYRSSEADNRKMKSWITGSVGGAYTSDIDELRMHYLTERCLITQAANNFFLFKGEDSSAATFNSGTLSGAFSSDSFQG